LQPLRALIAGTVVRIVGEPFPDMSGNDADIFAFDELRLGYFGDEMTLIIR
jgi:hypothetical protein